jgi:predicted O-methyltransferase YrrM
MREDNLNKLGFEGDPHVLPVIEKLAKKNKVGVIIETGTFFGNTTAKFAELGLPVVTIESQSKQFAAAYKNLKAKGYDVDKYQDGTIWMVNAHSQDVLGQVIDNTGQDSILFYLDAHWESHLPLLNELDHIAKSGVKAVIVIHDFQVPNKDFGFDVYGGHPLNYEFIKDKLEAIYPKGYNYFYNEVAEGHKRGLIFIEPK